MAPPNTDIVIRDARQSDLPFIRSLSPILAGVAKLKWHSDKVVQDFQDGYIDAMMADTSVRNITLIAEKSGQPLGFIHAREREDEVSGEECGTVPLLAVDENAQGTGVGRKLMDVAEDWSKAQGFRLLHLEVFAANDGGRAFYDKLGFMPETINMIKPLS